MSDQSDHNSQGQPDRLLTLSKSDRDRLASLFARAGIDIHRLRTWGEFHQALEMARPYLEDDVRAIANQVPENLEGRALRAAIEGDQETANRLLDQLETRSHLDVY